MTSGGNYQCACRPRYTGPRCLVGKPVHLFVPMWVDCLHVIICLHVVVCLHVSGFHTYYWFVHESWNYGHMWVSLFTCYYEGLIQGFIPDLLFPSWFCHATAL